MANQVFNDWSPFMKALLATNDGGGDVPTPEQQVASVPTQPSQSAPPAHRIEDDRTAGTRGATPQSDSYDPVQESANYDLTRRVGNAQMARQPIADDIAANRASLDQLNQPPPKPTLRSRIGSVLSGVATGARGEGALEQQATLADRAAARKQQERESLSNRISSDTRTLSQEELATQRMQEQEEMQRNTQIAAADALGRRLQTQEQIASGHDQTRRDIADNKSPSFEEAEYSEWANKQKALGKPTDRLTFEQQRKASERTPRAPTEREEWMKDHKGASMEDYWKAKATAPMDAKSASAEKTKLMGMEASTKYANDYIQRGVFTGPGDEALQEKFFDLARPEKGFRMTDAQIQMLRQSREWMGTLEAKTRHATTGTWFSDKQRRQIAGTMNDIYRANQGAAGGGATQPQAGGGIQIIRDANGRITGVQ